MVAVRFLYQKGLLILGDMKAQLSVLALLLSLIAIPAMAATGNQDTLCKQISNDLNVAGGCVDDDGLEDAVTSSISLYTLEIGNKAGFIILGFALLIFFGAIAGAIAIITGKKGAMAS